MPATERPRAGFQANGVASTSSTGERRNPGRDIRRRRLLQVHVHDPSAILRGEPGHEDLARAILNDPAPKLSAATAVELYAVADVRGDPAQRRRVDALLRELGVRIVAFDEGQAAIARDAYRDYGRGSGHPAQLNLGDCFGYALAVQANEPLLFVGDDFARTDVETVNV